MSEDPKKRHRRGRPAKNPEKRVKVRSESMSSSGLPEIDAKSEKSKYHNRMLDNYDEMFQNFSKDGISQQSQHLIRKIIHSPLVPEAFKIQPLLIIFNNIMQELMMNELEIVVLSIYLEKFVWQDETTQLNSLLRFAGYAVKVYLCEELNPINAYLSNKYPGFMEDFTQWQERFKSYLSVNPKDLNDKYKELSKSISAPSDSKIMDYNYYVDEILQIIPSLMYEKQPLEELTKDPEIMSLYVAYKSQSHIVLSDEENSPMPTLVKLDSVLSGVHEFEPVSPKDITIPSALMKKIDSICDALLSQNEESKEEEG